MGDQGQTGAHVCFSESPVRMMWVAAEAADTVTQNSAHACPRTQKSWTRRSQGWGRAVGLSVALYRSLQTGNRVAVSCSSLWHPSCTRKAYMLLLPCFLPNVIFTMLTLTWNYRDKNSGKCSSSSAKLIICKFTEHGYNSFEVSPFSQVSEVAQILKSSRVNRKLINIPILSKFRKKANS